ncbi:hypothetical protein DESUT3_22110 [Desulfuromonas versatilis]|uniref:AsmA domain-containing protein n=1 Tax=Desulfuromonas versatilis TaxID=2802975 RepID=A0ABM8HX45_9BACT|nr:AsmA family protein [Desulfuromonas versatilis]BCR05142.1 hypothetical protein DESUT3_22110 [Desulfuromonas versatilis]
MKKFGKIFGLIAALLVVLAIAAAVLAKFLITPERVRDAVLPLAQKALQREVQLGEIEVSLFSGINLKNLVIQERDGSEPFVAADQVVLRYQLWPLLFGQVVIDEVRLVAPKIRVARLADKSFNFSDLAGAGAQEEGKAEAPPADADKAATPINLLVSQVGIDNGELMFLDYGINAQAPYRYKLSELQVSARDISLEKSFPFSVKSRLNGSTLAIDGEASIKEQGGRAKVQVTNFDVTAFAPYFREQLPGKLGSLKVDLDLEAQAGAGSVASNGKILLRDIDLVLEAMQDAPIRDTRLGLEYRIRTDLAASRLDIETAKVDLNGIKADLAGKVENLKAKPLLDVTLAIPDLDLRSALAAVPKELVQGAAGLNPSGKLNARIHLAGTTDAPLKLLQEGQLTLDGVQVTAGGERPSLSGVFSLKGDSVASDNLQLKLGDNQANIGLKAGNLFGKPIVISSAVTSERFLIDPLLKGAAAPAVAGEEAKPAPAAKGAPASEIGPFDLPLKADGTVKIKQALYQGLSIDNFDMAYRLIDNVLTIDKMTGNVAGGTFSETATVDLRKKGLAYKTNLNVQGVKAEPVVAVFMPKASGTVFGTLNINGEFSGTGTLPDAIKRSLGGNGKLVLADGKLTGSNLVQGFSQFLNLEELRDLQFSQAKGSFTVENGRVKLSSDFSGKDLRMAPQGSVGLDGSLDVRLDARISPALTDKLDKKGKFTQFLKDQEGWGQVPVLVTGTAARPSFALDTSAIKGQVEQKVKQEVQKKLQEKVLDKLAPAEGEPGKEEPAKQLLRDTLKGILGN